MGWESFSWGILTICGIVNGTIQILEAIIENTALPRVLFAILYFAGAIYCAQQVVP